MIPQTTPARDGERYEVPFATHSGVVTIGGVDMHVHQLSDGRRIIEADDVARFFSEAMNITPEEIDRLARALRGTSE